AEALRPREAVRRTLSERPLLTVEQRQQMLNRFDTLLRELHKMEPGQRNGTLRLHMNRLYGIAMSLGENLDNVDELVREAYYSSGGSDDHQIETFIEWSRERAEFEAPSDETDEEFEAEVQLGVRREKVRAAVRERLQPVRLSRPSAEDVLTFNPEAAQARWWVRDFLPRGVTGILFAPPNTGKSFMAIDLACGVATGSTAWACPVPRGRVLYLAGEGHAGLPVRRRAWEQHHRRDAGDALELRKMRLVLSSEESVAEDVELVRSFKADVIIVDTLLRAMQGFTLENPNEASLAIARLDMIREAAGDDATLLVLHHPAKSNPDVPAGSYPIEGNVDTVLPLHE